MKIGQSFNFNSIDIKKPKAYNVHQVTRGFFVTDVCSFSGKSGKMSSTVQEETEKLKSSFQLQNSIVSYIPDLVERFFNGNLSETEFSEQYVLRLNKAKFYLSQMPKELNEANRNTFANEFKFADEINDIAKVARKEKVESFSDKLLEIVRKYNNLYQDAF